MKSERSATESRIACAERRASLFSLFDENSPFAARNMLISAYAKKKGRVTRGGALLLFVITV